MRIRYYSPFGTCCWAAPAAGWPCPWCAAMRGLGILINTSETLIQQLYNKSCIIVGTLNHAFQYLPYAESKNQIFYTESHFSNANTARSKLQCSFTYMPYRCTAKREVGLLTWDEQKDDCSNEFTTNHVPTMEHGSTYFLNVPGMKKKSCANYELHVLHELEFSS